jgi:hypothetical protein
MSSRGFAQFPFRPRRAWVILRGPGTPQMRRGLRVLGAHRVTRRTCRTSSDLDSRRQAMRRSAILPPCLLAGPPGPSRAVRAAVAVDSSAPIVIPSCSLGGRLGGLYQPTLACRYDKSGYRSGFNEFSQNRFIASPFRLLYRRAKTLTTPALIATRYGTKSAPKQLGDRRGDVLRLKICPLSANCQARPPPCLTYASSRKMH